MDKAKLEKELKLGLGGQPAIGIRNENSRPGAWCKASAFPAFADDGSLRRVLLTLAELSQFSRLASENLQLSTHDPLTGVFNRRYISLLLDDEGRRTRRYGTPFTLSLMAIDHFSEFCQKSGLQAAEGVLAEVSRLLCKTLREVDMLGHFGAGEFLLILPNTRVDDAMIALERLCGLVETVHESDPELPLTISGGVIEYTGETSAVLIERARSLLTNAREAGCNRLCVNLDMF